ncbi:MAG: NDP-sugar synthase [Candidatus Micrarchaeota archaeon]
MRAIVLAGGYGTRLYPITLRTPKPLLPLAGRPVVLHLIESLAKSGVTEITVSLKANQLKIADSIGDGRRLGCRVSYLYEPGVDEGRKLGSVGALEYVFSKMESPKQCFVIGADNYFHGLDFKKLRDFHSRKGAHATLALFRLADPALASHFGIAVTDGEDRIREFQEKPAVGSAKSMLASTAAYYLADDFLCEHIPRYCGHRRKTGRQADRIGDLWEHYLSDLRLYGYVFEGTWGDIGNAENYLETDAAALSFERGSSGTKLAPGMAKRRGVVMGRDVEIDASASIRGPVFIGDGCSVGRNAVIGPNASVLHDTSIGSGAVVSGSVVFERVNVGDDASIENSVVDGGCRVGPHARISATTVGFKCAIGGSAELRGSKVFPFRSVAAKAVLDCSTVGSEHELSAAERKELEESLYWL